nr:tigger transposable element-derived protein 4-like [Procambarus clarkii]
MADREFEEFRQYFEQLPQHIKAPSSCYTATEGEATVDGAGARVPVVEPLFIREESYLCGKPLGASSEPEAGKRVNAAYKEAGATHGKARAVGPKVTKTSVTFPTCLRDVLATYDPEDVFSAGEFALYYSLVPETRTTKTPRREFYGSCAKSDRRLTVLLAVNMSGTARLPLFVVGRLAMSSRSFRGVHTLPASYRKEKHAKLTAAIFEEWIREIDQTLFDSQRSVVMVLEKNTAHPPLKDLRAITLIFFPDNANKIQPLREGIILIRYQREICGGNLEVLFPY